MSWSIGLCKKHQSGSAWKEGHAGKDMCCLCFYSEQSYGFLFQLSSATPSAVDFDETTYFVLISSCQKAAVPAGIVCSMKRLCTLYSWLGTLNQGNEFVFKFIFTPFPPGAFNIRLFLSNTSTETWESVQLCLAIHIKCKFLLLAFKPVQFPQFQHTPTLQKISFLSSATMNFPSVHQYL